MQDGVFSGDTVAADMIAFANYWGIDMQNSWLDQETDPKKKNFMVLHESPKRRHC